MYLPMIVRPMVAKKAAMPTIQFASTPDSIAWNQAVVVPTEW